METFIGSVLTTLSLPPGIDAVLTYLLSYEYKSCLSKADHVVCVCAYVFRPAVCMCVRVIIWPTVGCGAIKIEPIRFKARCCVKVRFT